ncbi:hypothetical protein P170DRAFT_471148 [Aspergillus steynii IBT 23096]|uniref:Uncharacterized protein n=1 Tax=Aspergillus steynii IBT 23096 TaxID=1392250 RepID=A0A2I2GS97_9EURO|nr:uncharacterized protein P170DRAFT_471148 [Aspergillus steynii IBT 23096]PLB55748.1 hypothetical protein P170DRAFT_471148 [Aspergillus steynii IBT 23096]
MYEAAMKLTLGNSDFVFFGRESDGREIMKFGKSHNDNMKLTRALEELEAGMELMDRFYGFKERKESTGAWERPNGGSPLGVRNESSMYTW